jgi:O-acetyl-ADP-ribose deacetylase (regulator of RNase III)
MGFPAAPPSVAPRSTEEIVDAIKVVSGDITKLKVEAIVNAANSSLMGGGGADGAIHAAAGPGLKAECQTLRGCKVGEAKATKSHNLAARGIKAIIHTVGPVWTGEVMQLEQLALCYMNSMKLANQMGLTSIAFPCISTGACKFPQEMAAIIALGTVGACMEDYPGIKEVVFCCLQPSDLAFYQDITNGRGRNPEDVFAEAEAEVRSAFEAAPSGGGRASGLRSGR